VCLQSLQAGPQDSLPDLRSNKLGRQGGGAFYFLDSPSSLRDTEIQSFETPDCSTDLTYMADEMTT
jgi:hypothetical protein